MKRKKGPGEGGSARGRPGVREKLTLGEMKGSCREEVGEGGDHLV